MVQWLVEHTEPSLSCNARLIISERSKSINSMSQTLGALHAWKFGNFTSIYDLLRLMAAVQLCPVYILSLPGPSL